MFIGKNLSSYSEKNLSQCHFVRNINVEHFIRRKYVSFTGHVALLRQEIMLGWMCSWDGETLKTGMCWNII
jgi:hypothetical protein